MINTFSLQKISRTGNIDAYLISRRYYNLNVKADFMRIKYENPKLKHSEIANQLGYSTSTLQRYRKDINMLSPYRIMVNKQITLINEQKRFQTLMLKTIHIINRTSKDFK